MPKPAPFCDVDFTRTEADRFWGRVAESTEGDCWLWTGHLDAGGYGRFAFRGTGTVAHRAAYMMMVGEIPEGLELDHLCRVPACVNPDHLEPVTPSVNVRRSSLVAAETCANGHAWSENAVTYSGGTGRPERRYCLTCTRERAKASMDARRRRDGVPIKGTLTHCKRGHEFTPENTRLRKDRPGHRECLTCARGRT